MGCGVVERHLEMAQPTKKRRGGVSLVGVIGALLDTDLSHSLEKDKLKNVMNVFYLFKPTATLVAFIGVTRAHGTSPQPTTCRSPT